jgi:hypothetical protein
MRRLLSAECLKLRRRRSLVASTVLLVVAPVVASFTLLAALHVANPARYAPAGGAESFEAAVGMLGALAPIAAVLIGACAGGGDLAAGVFRELVVTGRARLVLFAVRVPGALSLLAPAVLTGWAMAAAASLALAGSAPRPGALLLAESGAWLLLAATVTVVLAAGVSSLLESRATAIGVLLTWQIAAAPLLLRSGKADGLLVGAAIERLQPGDHPARSLSLLTAIVLTVAWTAAPLAAGAWRTHTRDA